MRTHKSILQKQNRGIALKKEYATIGIQLRKQKDKWKNNWSKSTNI